MYTEDDTNEFQSPGGELLHCNLFDDAPVTTADKFQSPGGEVLRCNARSRRPCVVSADVSVPRRGSTALQRDSLLGAAFGKFKFQSPGGEVLRCNRVQKITVTGHIISEGGDSRNLRAVLWVGFFGTRFHVRVFDWKFTKLGFCMKSRGSFDMFESYTNFAPESPKGDF